MTFEGTPMRRTAYQPPRKSAERLPGCYWGCVAGEGPGFCGAAGRPEAAEPRGTGFPAASAATTVSVLCWLTAHAESYIRHCASVSVQQQLQLSALNLRSASAFCCALSCEKSTPGDSAVTRAHFVAGNGHGVIDPGLLGKRLYVLRVVHVHRQADDLEHILITALQRNQVWRFRAAWPAPRGPEVQQHDFPARGLQRHRLSVQPFQLEFRRRFRMSNKPDYRQVVARL